MDENTTYEVCVWNVHSECSYHYGPFSTYEDAAEFANTHSYKDGNEGCEVSLVNHPSLVGTGYQRSII